VGKGSNTTTQSSSTTPNPIAFQDYQNVLNNVANVAATPYQAYTGQLVAPVNAQQNAGIGGINQYAQAASPYLTQAAGLAANAAQPITSQQINQYLSPYTQDVVNATQAQFNDQNAQAAARLTGNQISQGALGGNRAGVAQATLAGQQQLAQAPTIANLYNQGYQTALNTAQQQQQAGLAGAYGLSSIGQAYQNAGLTGAQAQIGAGTLQQNTQQALDQALLNQWNQQQAYPFQTAQWQAGLTGAIAPGLGTSSQGQTTAPAPNIFNQIAGLGIAGAGVFLPKHSGGRVHKVGGGGLGGFPYGAGLTPYGGVGYVPTVNTPTVHLSSTPFAPAPKQDDGSDFLKQAEGFATKAAGSSNSGMGLTVPGTSATSDALNDYFQDQAAGEGGSLGDYLNFARGGPVHMADGGDPTFDDIWNSRIARVPPDAPPDSVNPDDPIRMPDEQAVSDWRAGVDRPNAAIQAEAGVKLPPQIKGDEAEPAEALSYAPRAGVGAPPAVITGAGLQTPDNRDDAQAGYGSQSEGNSWLTPNVRQALIAAGLGMLSSKSPFLGVGIGEGGLLGLKQYNESVAADQKARADQIRQVQEDRRIQFEADRIAQTATAQTETARHNKATEEREFKPQLVNDLDPDTGLTRHYVYDPEKQQLKDLPTPVSTSPVNAVPTQPNVQGKPGDGTIQTNNQQQAVGYNYAKDAPYMEKGLTPPEPTAVSGHSVQSLKTDAEMYLETGKLPPLRVGKTPMAVMQNNYRNAVQNYGNAQAASRGMTPEQVADAWRTAPGMLRFIMGQDGRAVISLGVAVRHLDTLRQLAEAFQSSNYPRIRSLQATLSREFGDTAASDIDSASHIVGPEIIKALGVAGAGTEDERKGAASQFSTSRGAAQVLSNIKVVERLLNGQLQGKQRQSEAVGVTPQKFKQLIGEDAYDTLSKIDKGGSTSQGAKPSLQEFLAKARDANPGKSDDELSAYYKQKYGG
jgi:hypothetical protein